ncbi:properdin [Pelodytes ibericus]
MLPLPVLLPVVWGLLLLQRAGCEDVLCFADSDETAGSCSDLLGGGVTDLECCMNVKYSYKLDKDSPCVGCRQAQWSAWGEWSACTVSCAEGVQIRRRSCIGQGDCPGKDVEVQACVIQECCPVDGSWSVWSAWSSCSVTCASGERQRKRECDNPAPVCGGGCIGQKTEVTPCNTQQVCPTHGSWGSWAPWGSCSGSCIQEGSGVLPTQTRHRQCNSPSPSTLPPGRRCEGNAAQSQACDSLPFCPVNGGWGGWRKISECSVTCGLGRITEERLCNNPAPKYGGRDCTGPSTQHIICKTDTPCPIDGQWSEWQDWTECLLLGEKIKCTKKVGLQNRRRECLGQDHDGNWCGIDYRESRKCYNVQGCFLKDTLWSEWSEWSLCSSPCGKSERSRERVCKPTYSDYPDFVETTSGMAEVFFSGKPLVRCPLIDGQHQKVVETVECKNVPQC